MKHWTCKKTFAVGAVAMAVVIVYYAFFVPQKNTDEIRIDGAFIRLK